MDEWKPLVVMPNADVRRSLECEFAAIVPPDDARIAQLCADHPTFQQFLYKFSGQFGEQIWPSIILLKHDAPQSFRTAEAVTAFRDILSMAVVPLARARRLRYKQANPLIFSTPFQLYPWMIDAKFEDVILTNPAQLHAHLLNEFSGQSFPEQSQVSILERDIDLPLCGELVSRWVVRYSGAQIEWKEKALFRCLNMANEAASIHALTAATFYDVGRSLALWVSAFEILAHPGGNGQSNFWTVCALLESVNWIDGQLSQLAYEIPGNPPQQKQLAIWICKQLYNLRNDFLHGNDVDGPNLQLKGNVIVDYAPCIFRMALTGFLDLKFKGKMPSVNDSEAIAKFLADKMDFNRFQKSIEAALLTAA